MQCVLMGRGCSVALGEQCDNLASLPFMHDKMTKRRKVLWLLPLPPSPHACLHRKDSMFLLSNTEVTSLQFLSHCAQVGGVYLPHSKEKSIFGTTFSCLKSPILYITELSEAFLRGRRSDTNFSLVHSGSHRS